MDLDGTDGHIHGKEILRSTKINLSVLGSNRFGHGSEDVEMTENWN
jgi:hypothetical protein